MTEVGLADRLELLRQKRAEYSSIVRSRKRKLRELYAVATDGDGALNLSKFDVDAPPTKPGETKFLLDTDILQGRSLSDARIPTRQKPDLETLKQFFASANGSSTKHEIPVIARPTTETPTPSTPSTQSHDASRLDNDSSSYAAATRTPQPYHQPTLNPTPALKSAAARTPATVSSPNASKPDVDVSSEASSRSSNPSSVLPLPNTSKPDGIHHNAESSLAAAAPAATVTPNSPEQDKQVSATYASPELMDIDIEPKPAQPDAALTSVPDHHASNGTTKTTDIPSSPESTAQTATTPAVHDVSVNTSPENDADSYVDRDEKTNGHQSQIKAVGQNDEPRDDTVEAQLLQESAAAVGSQADGKSLITTTHEIDRQNDGTAMPDSTPMSLPPGDVDEELPGNTKSTSKPTAAERPAIEAVPHTAPQTASTKNASDEQTHDADSLSILATLPTPKASTGDANENLHLSELVATNNRKDKRRAPTVLFGKQKKTKPDTTIVPSNLAKSDNLFAEDYFTPLFVQTFSQNAKWMKSMDQLVHHARKTLSSADNQASMFDTQSCKILKRIYHLQQQDKWSLRQPKRVSEPTRQKAHWDLVLDEMKWLRTDFRHERRWKMSHARILASACAAWTRATPAERKRMQVNAVIPKRHEQHQKHKQSAAAEPNKPQEGLDDGMEDIPMIGNAMIDAAKDGEDGNARPSEVDEIDMVDDGMYEDVEDDIVQTITPSAIFAMQQDELVFQLNPSVASDRLLAELPMYSSPLQVPTADITAKDKDPDAAWRRPVVPVSKYIETPIVIVKRPPPQKRSRFDIVDEPDDAVEEFDFGASHDTIKSRKAIASAPDCVVGLFDPAFKSVRERIHTGHQFRPPSEYAMPMQSFYEHRPASQWTISDDDQLKKLVREYSYNWTLIASLMTKQSLYLSGAERRTSWECFERWVGLEGYPVDASRSPYFKVYQSRIDAAQRAIKEANEKLAAAASVAAAASAAAAAQAGGSAGSTVPAAPPTPTTLQRRRQTVPVRVEKHRNQKYYSMLEAIKRLTKKREVNQTKQASAPRKAEAAPAQRAPTKSPREYSKIRWEREQKLADKMAEFAQRQNEALRRQQMMARQQNQAMGAGGGVNGVPPQVAAHMAAANSMAMAGRPNMPGAVHGVPIPGQQVRPRMPIQNPANPIAGLPAHMAAAVGTPNPMANLQPHQIQQMLAAQQRMQLANDTTQPDLSVVLQARRIHDQQRAVQLQQAQQHGQLQAPPNQHLRLQQQLLHQHQLQQQQQQLQQQQQQQQQAQLPQNHTPLAQHGQLAQLPPNGAQHPHLTPQQQHVLQQQHLQQMLHHQHAQAQAQQLQLQLQQQAAQQQAAQQQQQQQAQQQVQQQGQQQGQQQAQQVQQQQAAQTPQVTQAQQLQQTPQAHAMAKVASVPVSQGSPTGMRGGAMPGVNQQNFMANAHGGMQTFTPTNGVTVGSPVGAGMNMAAIAAGTPSPRPPMQQQLPPNIMLQIKELENGFRAKNPNLTAEQARNMAVQNYSHIMMMQRASAMHSASGGGPQQALAGTSPRQYAQLLRAQQAQQVQQAQQTGQHHVTQVSHVAHAQAAQVAHAQAQAQAQAQAAQVAQAAQLQAGSPLLAQHQAAQLARQASGTPVPNGSPPATTK